VGKKKKRAPPATLSPRLYGDHRGVSRQAVMKAIEAGRLARAITKTDAGHYRIDVELADREWEAWSDPAHAESGRKKAGGRPPVVARTPSLFGEQPGAGAAAHAVSHARASAERTLLDVELRRLELRRELGELVDRSSVQREAFALARVVRDRLLQVPDRAAARLNACESVGSLHAMLTEELILALGDLVSLQPVPPGAPAPEGRS